MSDFGAAIDGLYTPPAGKGPGVLYIVPSASASLAQRAGYLASEGYLVQAAALQGGLLPEVELKNLLTRTDKIAAIASGTACVPAIALAEQGQVAVLALYDPIVDPARFLALRCPVIVHFGQSPQAPVIETAVAGTEIYFYRDADAGFADPEGPAWNPYVAGIAYSRTLALLRRELGPRYNLSDLWDRHVACEFELKDATENMKTMVPEPYVNHVPTMTGGVGHDLLKRFYTHHFIGLSPTDRRTIPISRTIGPDRVIEEKVFCFTHDTEIDWMLPGIKPTGKYVEIPLVVVITFRGDKLYNEHIYWDQASVLAQLGLIDPEGLPVAGIEQARKLLDKTLPSNTLMDRWKTSEGKPI